MTQNDTPRGQNCKPPLAIRRSGVLLLSATIPILCGEVAERSKAAVLKTVEARASGGSNPSLSANNNNMLLYYHSNKF